MDVYIPAACVIGISVVVLPGMIMGSPLYRVTLPQVVLGCSPSIHAGHLHHVLAAFVLYLVVLLCSNRYSGTECRHAFQNSHREIIWWRCRFIQHFKAQSNNQS